MSRFATRLILVCCWAMWDQPAEAAVPSKNDVSGVQQVWARLLGDAERIQLPTKFLKALPPGFVHIEFDDLRTYAAEYHPDDHRMVLDRSLSFNAAGRVLKPLSKMSPRQLEVLYHELFHAYVDYLSVSEAPSDGRGRPADALLQFARAQQACRYGVVEITPIVQRKDATESRYLTQAESWEALNETWAVFIGWAVWNQLEVQGKTAQSMFREPRHADHWMQRFKAAFENGEFRGYYVPEDPDERRLTQKRYLAQQSQLGVEEAMVLMNQALGFKQDFIERLRASFESSEPSSCSNEGGATE